KGTESSSTTGYSMQEAAAVGGLPKTYLLHVGGDTWYKNRLGVLLIYSAIRNRLGCDSPDLVMVGPPLRTVTEGVHFLSVVTDAELAELYRNAALLLFPSFYEGFGWPIVESQACGCPACITGLPPLH